MDQELGDVGDLTGAFSGRQAREFDDAVTKELESFGFETGVETCVRPRLLLLFLSAG